MPLPTHRDVNISDPVLTDLSIGYGQDVRNNFISFRGSTMRMEPAQSAKYAVWDKGDWMRSEAQKRAEGTPAKEGGNRVSSDQYFAEVYALRTLLTERAVARASVNSIELERVKTRWISEQLLLKRDLVYQDKIFKTGLWTANTEQTGVAAGPGANQFLQWDVSGSSPLTDLINYIDSGRTAIGRTFNTMTTTHPVWNILRTHPDFVDLFKHTAGGLPNEEKLASVLGLENVIIGGTVQNTAAEGQTAVMADVFGKDVLLSYIDQNPDETKPTAVTGFSWSEFDKMTPEGASVRKYREDSLQGDWLEGEAAFDFKITANDAGLFLKDAVG